MSATRRDPARISQRNGELIDRDFDLIRGYREAQLEGVDNMDHVPEGAKTVMLPRMTRSGSRPILKSS